MTSAPDYGQGIDSERAVNYPGLKSRACCSGHHWL